MDGPVGPDQTERAPLWVTLWRAAVQHHWLAKSPVDGLPLPKKTDRDIAPSRIDQRSAFDGTPTDTTERAVLDLTLGHGWRQGEVRASRQQTCAASRMGPGR